MVHRLREFGRVLLPHIAVCIGLMYTGIFGAEYCRTINPDNVRTEFVEGYWSVVDGSEILVAVSSQENANKARDIIKFYGFNSQCAQGMWDECMYFTKNGEFPTQHFPDEDAVPVNPFNFAIVPYGPSGWRVQEGDHYIYIFSSYEDAFAAVELMKKNNIRWMCYVDRPAPPIGSGKIIMQYFLSGNKFESFQPSLPPERGYGGRAMCLTVNPRDENTILVGSETGGMFRTTDGGTTWSSVLNTTPGIVDLQYSDQNPSIAVAATAGDWYVSPNGGIKRSTDRGKTWSRPHSMDGTHPFTTAFCVNFRKTTSTVFAGTDAGVLRSDDLGNSWIFVNQITPGAFVTSILVLENSRLVTVVTNATNGVNGVYISTNDGTSWSRASGDLPTSDVRHCQLAVSPLNSQDLFLASRIDGTNNVLYQSTDGGSSWSQVTTYASNARQPFVRVSLSPSTASGVDIYFGSGQRFYKATATTAAGRIGTIGSWSEVSIAHADISDICFANDNKTPLLVATDGGLHKWSDAEGKWVMACSGKSGYNALQITEVTGQIHPDDGHTDLYFGTQDNCLWSSQDAGETWTNFAEWEGYFISLVRNLSGHSQTKVIYRACSGCNNYLSDAHFENPVLFPNPPSPYTERVGMPVIVKPGYYLQCASASTEPGYVFRLSTDNCATWTSKFTINEPAMAPPKFAGPVDNPDVFVAVKLPGTLQNGVVTEVLGLKRITGLLGTGTSTVTDVKGIGSIGTFMTMFAWYKVYAVNPDDPDHIIVPDVAEGTMRVTHDGGANWTTDMTLTNLVTRNGALHFSMPLWGVLMPQVTTISFNPDNPNTILIGTQESGIIQSTDGGTTWARIENSEQIPFVSSFFFGSDGNAIASSYGRGLWKIYLPASSSAAPAAAMAYTSVSMQTGKTGTVIQPIPITGTGLYSVSTNENVYVLNKSSYKYGMMFTVRNYGQKDSVTLKWFGVRDQNQGNCTDQTAYLYGNGAQINNVCTPKSSDGKMYLRLSAKAACKVTIEVFDWRNGPGWLNSPTNIPVVVSPVTGQETPLAAFDYNSLDNSSVFYLTTGQSEVTDLDMNDNFTVNTISLSFCTMIGYRPDKTVTPVLPVVNNSSVFGSFSGNAVLQNLVSHQRHIKGFLMQGCDLRGILVAPGDISPVQFPVSVPTSNKPVVSVSNPTINGGTPFFDCDVDFVLRGGKFAASMPLQVSVDYKPLSGSYVTDAAGNFSVHISKQMSWGPHCVLVTQNSGTKTLQDIFTFNVHSDEEDD